MGFAMLIFVAIPLLNVLAAVGVVIVLLVANVFLSAWKAALVFKDLDVVGAFGDSYRFVKKYFWPMALVVLIRGIFDGNNNNGLADGHGGGVNVGGMDVNFNLPGLNLFGMDASSIIGWGSVAALLTMVPLMVIAAVVSLVVMVYIDELIFVIYARREGLA